MHRTCTLWLGALIPLLLWGCALSEVDTPATQDWPQSLRVYFSDPSTSPYTATDKKLPEKIAAMIRTARKSVDINIYELSEATIYNALIEMHKKGIRVRMVGDIENTGYEGYKALHKAGVPMRLGNADNIMHNKFVIVDDKKLTMGSMNYTGSGALMNNENVVFIENTNIAAYYKKEFDNMFVNGAFGLQKQPFAGFTDNTFTLDNGSRIEVHFTPYRNAHPGLESANTRILQVISNAQESIYFAMFAYTSVDIAQAMIYMATNRGVKVFGAFDMSWNAESQWSTYQLFVDAGLNIVFDGNNNFYPDNPYHGGKIHSKYMVIDPGTTNAVVFTGSFNFSPAAATDGNDENCIFVFDQTFANYYLQDFMNIYRIGYHPTRDLGGETAGFHDVMITEINWAGSSTSWRDKFVELKNMTDRPLNISGWQLWGTVERISRTLGYIFPEGTVIPPGGIFVLYQDTAFSAFTYRDNHAVFPELAGMYNASGQNYVRLTLKDCRQNIVDLAGAGDAANQIPPFAGEQGYRFKSMVRIRPDGLVAESWETSSAANTHVLPGEASRTFASPGTH